MVEMKKYRVVFDTDEGMIYEDVRAKDRAQALEFGDIIRQRNAFSTRNYGGTVFGVRDAATANRWPALWWEKYSTHVQRVRDVLDVFNYAYRFRITPSDNNDLHLFRMKIALKCADTPWGQLDKDIKTALKTMHKNYVIK